MIFVWDFPCQVPVQVTPCSANPPLLDFHSDTLPHRRQGGKIVFTHANSKLSFARKIATCSPQAINGHHVQGYFLAAVQQPPTFPVGKSQPCFLTLLMVLCKNQQSHPEPSANDAWIQWHSVNRELQAVPFGSTHSGILESCGQRSCCWYIFNFFNENISETASKLQSFPRRHIASAPRWPILAEEQELPCSSKRTETGRGWMRWISLNNNRSKWRLVENKKERSKQTPPPINQEIPQTKTLKPNRNRTKDKVYKESCIAVRIMVKFFLTNAITLVILSASFSIYQSSHPLTDC